MPPVLNVALGELPSRCAQHVLAGEIGPRKRQGHDVLQLIAESEGAPGLIVPCTRPEAAAHILVQQPSVHQDVERVVRRLDLDRTERALPGRVHLFERFECCIDMPITAHELPSVASILAFAEQKHESPQLARLEHDPEVEAGARIQAGADLVGQRGAAQRRGVRQRSIPADKRRAMSGCGAQGLARRRERHSPREILVVGVSCEDALRLAVPFGDDTQMLAVERWPERPLVVGEDAQRPCPRAVVGDRQQREFDGGFSVDEDVESVADAMHRA